MSDTKTAMVVGMAKSGVSAAELLLRKGWRVVLSDTKNIEGLSARFAGDTIDALGKDPLDYLRGVSLLVLSPGVPMRVPVIAAARQRGIEVIGEIELASRHMRAQIVGITGTNGKTTTTALTGEMFKRGGFSTYVCGNIGVPMCDYALETTPRDIAVAEIASLQLESTNTFRPRAAAILNLTDDHMDRFGTMEAYGNAKRKAFENQGPQDTAIFNLDDPLCVAMSEGLRARKWFFSRLLPVQEGVCVDGGFIVTRDGEKETRIMRAEELRIAGAHNLENALAAVGLAYAMGVDAEAMAFAMRSFPGVEHRIEFVREVGGVRYINDSKGTNPDSTIKAVLAMDRPTVLLLGGSDKRSDFVPMFNAFTPHIIGAVVFGQTAEIIAEAAEKTGFCNLRMAHTMEEAIDFARGMCPRGGNVLLSPACASFDMFDDFEHRGSVFKRIVTDIRE